MQCYDYLLDWWSPRIDDKRAEKAEWKNCHENEIHNFHCFFTLVWNESTKKHMIQFVVDFLCRFYSFCIIFFAPRHKVFLIFIFFISYFTFTIKWCASSFMNYLRHLHRDDDDVDIKDRIIKSSLTISFTFDLKHAAIC